MTGKCKPGKVSRTVSRTPLTLDLIVVCTSSAVVPPLGVSSDTVVPPATVASEGIDVGTRVPVVAAPAPVEQPSPPVRGGGGGFMSLSFHSHCCRNLPSYFRWWRSEQFPGSESPLSLPVYAWPSGSAFLLDPTVLQTVLASGTSSLPEEGTSVAAPTMDLGDGRLLETGLPGCPYRFFRGPEACRFRMGIQRMAYSFIILSFWSSSEHRSRPGSSTVRRRSGCIVWARIKRCQQPSTYSRMRASNLQILAQFATVSHRMSFQMMALGIEQSLFPRAEVDDWCRGQLRAASYMSVMGLWHPQTGPGDPRPVPASSCRSCMNCKYCFPEDQLPPG